MKRFIFMVLPVFILCGASFIGCGPKEEAPETEGISDIIFTMSEELQDGEGSIMPGSSIGTLSVTGGKGDVTYSLVKGLGDDDNDRFTIDGDEVKIGDTVLLMGSYSFRVRARDSVSSREEHFSVVVILVTIIDPTQISDISFDPTPDLQEGEDNVAPNAVVGTLSATGGEGTITYTLVSGTGDTDNDKLTIEGNQVKVGNTALTAGTYYFRIKAQCLVSNLEKEFNFTVNVGEDSPYTVVFDEVSPLYDPLPAGTVVGTLSVTGTEDPVLFDLVSGDGDGDNASFIIDGDEVKVADGVTLSEGVYYFRVLAYDDVTPSFGEEAFSVTVVDPGPT
jgi:hypothetical protein